MRCYEFYCVVLTSPDICKTKSDETERRIYKYIDFMREKEVKFDKTPEDKKLFERLQEEHGSEYAITQPKQSTELRIELPETATECTSEACECEQTSIPQQFNSGVSEWYTPPKYIEAAKKVMGSITTDPASSDKAQETVNADIWYTKEDNGLEQEWAGHVWMNPPYSQPLVQQFCDLFVEKYKNKEFFEGCVFVNNATETAFMQNLLTTCTSICLVRGRVAFLDPEGNPGNPLQGQICFYFGPNKLSFENMFSKFGVVFHGTR